ncbi:MAG: hypothetical protein LBR79_01790 [Oscillospiraceae bacterium]|nr:hypothetical protein [Oscillospiraceae bacterium]
MRGGYSKNFFKQCRFCPFPRWLAGGKTAKINLLFLSVTAIFLCFSAAMCEGGIAKTFSNSDSPACGGGKNRK